MTTSVLSLNETSRSTAVLIARLEREITELANYVLSKGFRPIHCELRASRRAHELAQARKLVMDLHPEITRTVLGEVHDVLTRLPPTEPSAWIQ